MSELNCLFASEQGESLRCVYLHFPQIMVDVLSQIFGLSISFLSSSFLFFLFYTPLPFLLAPPAPSSPVLSFYEMIDCWLLNICKLFLFKCSDVLAGSLWWKTSCNFIVIEDHHVCVIWSSCSEFDKTPCLWKASISPTSPSVCLPFSLTHTQNSGQKQLCCGRCPDTNNALFQGAELMV